MSWVLFGPKITERKDGEIIYPCDYCVYDMAHNDICSSGKCVTYINGMIFYHYYRINIDSNIDVL